MDEDLYDVVSYLKVLQKRYDAVNELISSKNAKIIDENYHMIYPTLVKATWGMPEFAQLPHQDLREELEDTLREKLGQFVSSDDGVAKLEKQRGKITDTIDTVLVQTPMVLKETEISDLLALNETARKAELLDQFGLDVDQRSSIAGLSAEDYVKSLGSSDERTINEYLRELEFEMKMIRKWQMFIPSREYEQQIREHLQSDDVVKAIDQLKTGEGITGEKQAFELLDKIVKGPKDIISAAVIEAIREVPTGEYMENQEKDYLRCSYADPEDSKGVADPARLTKWQKDHMSDGNRWRMLRLFTGIFGACMAVQALSVIPGNMEYIKHYGHFIGYRSGYFD